MRCIVGTAAIVIILNVFFLNCKQVTSFSSVSVLTSNGRKTTQLWMAKKTSKKKKKKQQKPQLNSYAERLQQHLAEKSQGNVEIEPTNSSAEDKTSAKLLARQLVAKQRKSVDMLTFVRGRVDGLPHDGIKKRLEKDGYVVIDNFLANAEVVDQLHQEGESLFREDKMERDIADLESGEYVLTITGGQEQYPLCPRLVELVVCVTKHLPAGLQGMLELSNSASRAVLRAADRKTRIGLGTLLGEERISQGGPERSLGTVVGADENDKRRLTLFYYPNTEEWDGDGGITVGEERVRISSKRDRLVLMKSQTCVHRREYFLGKEETEDRVASCLELHLVSN